MGMLLLMNKFRVGYDSCFISHILFCRVAARPAIASASAAATTAVAAATTFESGQVLLGHVIFVRKNI